MNWFERQLRDTGWEVQETQKAEAARLEIESRLTGKTLEEFEIFYSFYRDMLKTYPPKSPPYSIPLRNPSDPEVYEVYINRGFKLHIRARYQVSEGICWIVQVMENA
jgi:hypothetical protein